MPGLHRANAMLFLSAERKHIEARGMYALGSEPIDVDICLT